MSAYHEALLQCAYRYRDMQLNTIGRPDAELLAFTVEFGVR